MTQDRTGGKTRRSAPGDGRRERRLLAFLASSPHEVFTREQLLERVWPPSADRGPSTVTEHIGRVRHRIEDDPERPRWIRTVRGVGYSFEP